jgi:hypothetical protein
MVDEYSARICPIPADAYSSDSSSYLTGIVNSAGIIDNSEKFEFEWYSDWYHWRDIFLLANQKWERIPALQNHIKRVVAHVEKQPRDNEGLYVIGGLIFFF